MKQPFTFLSPQTYGKSRHTLNKMRISIASLSLSSFNFIYPLNPHIVQYSCFPIQKRISPPFLPRDYTLYLTEHSECLLLIPLSLQHFYMVYAAYKSTYIPSWFVGTPENVWINCRGNIIGVIKVHLHTY